MRIFYRMYQIFLRIVASRMKWPTPKTFLGDKAYSKLFRKLAKENVRKVLLVSDSGLQEVGLLKRFTKRLEKRSIDYALYLDVQENPTIAVVENGVKAYHAQSCEGIVALGGGSVIDTAKLIGARVARPNKPLDKMKGLLKVRRKLPFLAAIPTTAGSGSEVTLTAVVSNPEKKEKYTINDHSLIPQAALLDASLTTGLPAFYTATTGMDALTHAIEAYLNKISNTQSTKRYAKEAVRLVFSHLQTAYDHPEDLEARDGMLHASMYAGLAFRRAYVGYVHALSHALSGQYDIPHGYANAVLLPYVLRAYNEAAEEKLAELAASIGCTGDNQKELATAFIERVEDLRRNLNISDRLEVPKFDAKADLVRHALKEAHPLYPVPKFLFKEDLMKILAKAVVSQKTST